MSDKACKVALEDVKDTFEFIYSYDNCKYSYDDECDAIFIELNDKLIYDSSVEVGSSEVFCVIDVDEKSQPIRLEFLDWSKVIKRERPKDFVVDRVLLRPVVGDTWVTLNISIDGERLIIKI